MFNFQTYNDLFLAAETKPLNMAHDYGVEVLTIPGVNNGNWQVLGVHKLTGGENQAKHHLYVDVLNGEGERIKGAKVRLLYSGGHRVEERIHKPAHEPGLNFPLQVDHTYSVAMADGPTEMVTNIHTRHPDSDQGNTIGHHSYYVVFQWRVKPLEAEPALTLGQVIAEAGQDLIIPLNREAMFYKQAAELELGERLSAEFDLRYSGKSYRAQVYERGILYAEIGDWDNVQVIEREN